MITSAAHKKELEGTRAAAKNTAERNALRGIMDPPV
jgi:hypothetical protein